jgi:hypothetical protein
MFPLTRVSEHGKLAHSSVLAKKVDSLFCEKVLRSSILGCILTVLTWVWTANYISELRPLEVGDNILDLVICWLGIVFYTKIEQRDIYKHMLRSAYESAFS